MVGPVKPGDRIFSSAPSTDDESFSSRRERPSPVLVFLPQGSSLQALPPPGKRRARPRRDVTTVDQSDIRVLVNALNDPSGASSVSMASVRATNGRAQGWGEGPPDPYTRRGRARRSAASGPHSGVAHPPPPTVSRTRGHDARRTSSRAIAHTKPTSSRA